MKKLVDFAKKMFFKYEMTISYLFFGFLAFLVCYITYGLCSVVLGWNYMVANIISWVVAVLFAYWTNRTFVFKSKVVDRAGIWKEISAFVSARLATGLMEIILMFLMVDFIHMHDMIAKLICQVLVIITNYVLSKIWIFKEPKTEVVQDSTTDCK